MKANPTEIKFPRVPASHCACCGIILPTGEGYLVPVIGAVGPKCRQKFGPLAQLVELLDGRTDAPAAARPALGRLMVSLRQIGVGISNDGTIRVTGLTRKAAEVAKSYKKRRAELVQDLQIASGLMGPEAQAARAAQVAA
ncbi:hypothetical protein [Deinococcus sp. 6GRE01]|uniref:hypothetical protein n=1 Tax=Deinococcus sp. 6GRE01 TaxID=2745873 RepID=UPI001E638CC2|nr:hypothetical protein [Deinococcus sp. 6GRE01]MCD0155976.1 hypothetical protein [Deinococcus sp. 6GRE01]